MAAEEEKMEIDGNEDGNENENENENETENNLNSNENNESNEDEYRTIEITNISENLKENHLRDIFSQCGKIEVFTVKLKFGVGRVCYIKFFDNDNAKDALVLKDQELDNKKLNIKLVHNNILNNFVDNNNDNSIQSQINEQTQQSQLNDQKSEEIKRAIKVNDTIHYILSLINNILQKHLMLYPYIVYNMYIFYMYSYRKC